MNRQVLRRYAQSALMPLLAIFTALVAGGVIIWLAGPRLQGEWFGIKFVLDGYAGLFQGAFEHPADGGIVVDDPDLKRCGVIHLHREEAGS